MNLVTTVSASTVTTIEGSFFQSRPDHGHLFISCLGTGNSDCFDERRTDRLNVHESRSSKCELEEALWLVHKQGPSPSLTKKSTAFTSSRTSQKNPSN